MADTMIELHDSSVRNLSWFGDTATIRLTVIIHKSEGWAGIDAGSVWEQQADLQLHHLITNGNFPDLPEYIYDGRVVINGKIYDNTFPFQFNHKCEWSGEIALELLFSDGTELTLQCSQSQLTLIGEAKIIEGECLHDY